MMGKKRRVHKMMENSYWDGFFARLGPSRCLMFTEGPRWWNDVADVAYEAGWKYADEVVAKLDTSRFGRTVAREIPPRVVADCYAAARLG